MPKLRQAFITTKQSAESRQVGQQNISGTRSAWRHPEKAIELSISCLRERVWLGQIDRLARENTNRTGVLRERIMRQVLVEVERRHPRQPSVRVEIPHRGQRRNLIGSLDHGGTETKLVLDGNTKSLHQRTRVQAETLLPRYQSVTVMGIFHLALLHVGGCTHVMVGPNDQACTFAREKLPNRF